MKTKSLLLLTIVSIVFFQCKKSNVTKKSDNGTESLAYIRPDDPNKPKNYCEGCGNSTDKDFGCMIQPNGVEDCSPTGCSGASINQFAEDNSINQSINLASCYDIRDNFLIHSDVGARYIGYYYKISEVMIEHGGLTLSNFSDHYNFATDFMSRVEVLRTGANNAVPFDNTFKTQALGFIAYYRTLESETVFQNALDQIEIDLDNYTNKTRAQILTSLALHDE